MSVVPASLDNPTNVITFTDGSKAYYPFGRHGKGYWVTDRFVENVGLFLSFRALPPIFVWNIAKASSDSWTAMIAVIAVCALQRAVLVIWTKRLPVCPYQPTADEWHGFEANLFNPYIVGIMWLVGSGLLIGGIYLATQFAWGLSVVLMALGVATIYHGVVRYRVLARREAVRTS